MELALRENELDLPHPPPYGSGICRSELKSCTLFFLSKLLGSNFSRSLISALDHCHFPIVSLPLPIFLM